MLDFDIDGVETLDSVATVLVYFTLWELSFFRCIFDACGCDLGGDCECLCTAISAYAQECNIRGASVKWRSQQLCRKCYSQKYHHYLPCLVIIHLHLLQEASSLFDLSEICCACFWWQLNFYLLPCHHKLTEMQRLLHSKQTLLYYCFLSQHSSWNLHTTEPDAETWEVDKPIK